MPAAGELFGLAQGQAHVRNAGSQLRTQHRSSPLPTNNLSVSPGEEPQPRAAINRRHQKFFSEAGSVWPERTRR